jgi:hypothetical protein
MAADTVRYCVVKADQSPGLVIDRLRTGNLSSGEAVGVIDHCTIYGRAGGSDAPLTVNIPSGNWPTEAGLKITNNIFYTASTASGSQFTTGYAFRVPRNRSFVSDYNLFAHYAGASKSAWYEIEGASSGYSAPGSGGWLCQNGSGQGWGAGLECNSVYGSPMFQDSSRAGFDPRLRSNSAARGRGTAGTDIGAQPFGVPVPDQIRPAAINDMSSNLDGEASEDPPADQVLLLHQGEAVRRPDSAVLQRRARLAVSEVRARG